eukprot:356199-Chlamydomonas_euryale.AAC.3
MVGWEGGVLVEGGAVGMEGVRKDAWRMWRRGIVDGGRRATGGVKRGREMGVGGQSLVRVEYGGEGRGGKFVPGGQSWVRVEYGGGGGKFVPGCQSWVRVEYGGEGRGGKFVPGGQSWVNVENGGEGRGENLFQVVSHGYEWSMEVKVEGEHRFEVVSHGCGRSMEVRGNKVTRGPVDLVVVGGGAGVFLCVVAQGCGCHPALRPPADQSVGATQRRAHLPLKGVGATPRRAHLPMKGVGATPRHPHLPMKGVVPPRVAPTCGFAFAPASPVPTHCGCLEFIQCCTIHWPCHRAPAVSPPCRHALAPGYPSVMEELHLSRGSRRSGIGVPHAPAASPEFRLSSSPLQPSALHHGSKCHCGTAVQNIERRPGRPGGGLIGHLVTLASFRAQVCGRDKQVCEVAARVRHPATTQHLVNHPIRDACAHTHTPPRLRPTFHPLPVLHTFASTPAPTPSSHLRAAVVALAVERSGVSARKEDV